MIRSIRWRCLPLFVCLKNGHGDDMLCADFGGARPSQALVRLNDFARLQRLAVTVDLPRAPADFRLLSPIVLEQALKKAGTELLEPYLHFVIMAAITVILGVILGVWIMKSHDVSFRF